MKIINELVNPRLSNGVSRTNVRNKTVQAQIHLAASEISKQSAENAILENHL